MFLLDCNIILLPFTQTNLLVALVMWSFSWLDVTETSQLDRLSSFWLKVFWLKLSICELNSNNQEKSCAMNLSDQESEERDDVVDVSVQSVHKTSPSLIIFPAGRESIKFFTCFSIKLI